jgi:anti-sigma B factor antagonist
VQEAKIESVQGEQEGVRIIRITGAFTIQTHLFEFQEMVRAKTDPVVIVDLSEVPYMDSAALGSLLGLHVSCQKENRKYGLAGVVHRVQTLFAVCKVQGMLTCFPTVEAAEKALAKR